MKKKQKKEKKEPDKTPNLPFFSSRINGKIEGISPVVYSFSLPRMKGEDFQESADFLEKIKDGFLHFLEKESKKKREGVYLGTLSFSVKGNLVTLFSSFSPFEEKEEKEVAGLLFSETGKLLAVKKK